MSTRPNARTESENTESEAIEARQHCEYEEGPLSIGSVTSVASVGSISSVASVGSIASVGSVGSIASVGSVGSIASIGKAGAIFNIPVPAKLVRCLIAWCCRRRAQRAQ